MVLRRNFGEEFIYCTEALENTEKKALNCLSCAFSPQIFCAMHLKMFQCDTFRRHARNDVEPATVHFWKTTQDRMLEQLSQQQNVILGDLRADSPGT